MFKSANHLTNNLIGALLISVLMFILVYAIDRGDPQPAGRAVLWVLGLAGLASLGGWMFLSIRQVMRSAERRDA